MICIFGRQAAKQPYKLTALYQKAGCSILRLDRGTINGFPATEWMPSNVSSEHLHTLEVQSHQRGFYISALVRTICAQKQKQKHSLQNNKLVNSICQFHTLSQVDIC